MIKTTLVVAGMICGMCEAHVNDAVRASFPVKKVTSSRSRGETVILSEAPLDPEKLRQAVSATGYTVLSVKEEPLGKHPLLPAFLRRKKRIRE